MPSDRSTTEDWIQKAAEEIARPCAFSGCKCYMQERVRIAAIIQRHAPAPTTSDIDANVNSDAYRDTATEPMPGEITGEFLDNLEAAAARYGLWHPRWREEAVDRMKVVLRPSPEPPSEEKKP